MVFDFNGLELAFLVPLIAICIATLVRNWFASPISIWAPTSILALMFLYYTAFGPVYFISKGTTDFLGVEFRPFFWKGWAASLLSYVSILLGYLSYQGSKEYIGPVCSDELLQKFAAWLVGLSFAAMLYWTTSYQATASMFNPFASDDVRGEITQFSTNPFANYLVTFINLSIPAMVLTMLVWLDRKSTAAFALMVSVFAFGTTFFLSSGFRFRLVWMAVAVVSAFFLWKKRRPNLLVLGAGGVCLFLSLGLIGMTRNYWSGLSLERASGASVSDFVDTGFKDAGIFISTCSVVEAIPSRINHTYFDPIIVTLAFPIPRALWPGKPESETLQAMAQSFGSREAADAGQAMPIFAEWYVAFGWPGLVASSFVLGLLSKRMWVWFLQRRDDKLVVLSYTATLGFLYFVFSRGYTPIMVQNFVFGLLPFFLLYGWLRRRAFLRALASVFAAQQHALNESRARDRRIERLKRSEANQLAE